MRTRALALAARLVVVAAVVPAFAGELTPGGTFFDDDGSIEEGCIEAISLWPSSSQMPSA